ncbi:uncharacterized protein LOC116615989 [Nematostella vectensis]|uniref:uncharacterized protein LOC116615989 n=1 Tax=Nematostella vectensis TaxID=45351 RepID=UPI00138FB3B1|nr:uncharacterized protein LOC116615989 [Nematostella vectensis]
MSGQLNVFFMMLALFNLAASQPMSDPRKRSVPISKRQEIAPHIMANPPITPSLLPSANDVTLMPNGIPASYGSVIHNLFRQHPNGFHGANLPHGYFGRPRLGPHYGPHVGAQIGPYFGDVERNQFTGPLGGVLGSRFPYVHHHFGYQRSPAFLMNGLRAGELDYPYRKRLYHFGIYGENTPEIMFMGEKPHYPYPLHDFHPFPSLLYARLLGARRRYFQHHALSHAMDVYLHGPSHATWDY